MCHFLVLRASPCRTDGCSSDTSSVPNRLNLKSLVIEWRFFCKLSETRDLCLFSHSAELISLGTAAMESYVDMERMRARLLNGLFARALEHKHQKKRREMQARLLRVAI